jgi:hypothetical protein
MMYLNVTNPNNSTYGKKSFSYLDSHIGKTFPVPSRGDDYSSFQLSLEWGGYLGIGSFEFGNDDTNISYTNPFDVSQEDFDSISMTLSFSIT